MLRWLPRGRLAWCLAAALLALTGLAWHFEAASRLDPAALEPRPGPLVLDRTGRALRLVSEAQGGKLVTLPDRAVPSLVAAAFVAAEDQRFWHHPGIDPLATPACVVTCPAECRIFGDISDPDSNVSHYLEERGPATVLRSDAETGAHVFYVDGAST